MIHRYTSLTLLLLLFLCPSAFSQRVIETDVCVYGGTSAGVVAAYTAEKLGRKAILVEPGKRLGGLTSGGLGYTDIGNKYAITGIARQFYRKVGDHYGKLEQWIFEPKVALGIFHDYVREGGFEVLYETRLKEVRKQGNRIVEVVLENAVNPSRASNIVVRAKM